MLLRPPRSTLFPYTRSSDLVVGFRAAILIGKFLCAFDLAAGHRIQAGILDHLQSTPKLMRDSSRPQNTDRKSTRLNSSHPSISYAVFCLKKKIHTPPPALTK